MIRQLAAAHASGSATGSSNSVNHFTSASLSPIVLNLCSIGKLPATVVTTSRATYSVAPLSSPAQLTVPLSDVVSSVASQPNPGSGVTVTLAELTRTLDCQVMLK